MDVAKKTAWLKPALIVLISPHGLCYSDYIHIFLGAKFYGDLGAFGAPQVNAEADIDIEFVKRLSDKARKEGLNAGTAGKSDLNDDHGAVIPLHFINKQYDDYKLVHISLSGLSNVDHYRLGMLIAQTAQEMNKDTVVVASGDLSHRLKKDGPYGYIKEGHLFDNEITAAMEEGDFLKFLSFSPDYAQKAAECGLKSFIIMAGALDRKDVLPKLLSYEAPFGVGYAVASFEVLGDNEERCFLDKYLQAERQKIQNVKQNEDEYVRLARYAVEYYVKNKKTPPLPKDINQELLNEKAGVFVSLKIQGNLRGCIGTLSPIHGSVAHEIIYNAVSACSEDPRFNPVSQEELPFLFYGVDVLSQPLPVTDKSMLDAKRYGVIVSKGRKKGVLLPDLSGIDTVEEQILIALKKAGISEEEDYDLEYFEVIRHQ